MTLASSISLTDANGTEYSETDFLPTNTLALDFDGTLDFNENDLTITDTSDVLVTYDSDNSGSDDTQLLITSLGNNTYDTSKFNLETGSTITPPTSGVYQFERTTDLTDVDTGIGLFDKNVLLNLLVKNLSNNFGSLTGTSLESFSSQLTGLDFDFKTVSGSLDMHDFKLSLIHI